MTTREKDGSPDVETVVNRIHLLSKSLYSRSCVLLKDLRIAKAELEEIIKELEELEK